MRQLSKLYTIMKGYVFSWVVLNIYSIYPEGWCVRRIFIQIVGALTQIFNDVAVVGFSSTSSFNSTVRAMQTIFPVVIGRMLKLSSTSVGLTQYFFFDASNGACYLTGESDWGWSYVIQNNWNLARLRRVWMTPSCFFFLRRVHVM